MNDISRKAVAVLLGLGTVAALLFMYRFASVRLAFFSIASLWIGALVAAARLLYGDWRAAGERLPLTLTTFAACAGLMSLLEWKEWVYLIVLLAGCFIALLHGWSVSPEESARSSVQKPFRRMKMMLWVFDAYALMTTMFAVHVFFPRLPFWVLHLLSAVFLMYVSYMIWRMYYAGSLRSMALWLLIVGLLMVECVWVLQLLPLGYLVSGLLTIWAWYIIQLLARFHFAEQGIVWKKQQWFLIINGVLFILLLILARWTPNTK